MSEVCQKFVKKVTAKGRPKFDEECATCDTPYRDHSFDAEKVAARRLKAKEKAAEVKAAKAAAEATTTPATTEGATETEVEATPEVTTEEVVESTPEERLAALAAISAE